MGVSSFEDSKKVYIKKQKIEWSPEFIPGWKNKIIAKQLENAICQLRILVKEIGSAKLGTGFLCKIPYPDEFALLPVLIKNNHIIDEENFKENKEIEIFFDDGNIKKN